MTSSNGNIFRVTSPLWGEFTGHRWIPLTKASDAEPSCFLWSAPKKRLSKPSRRRWFETPSRSLWCHCNVPIQKSVGSSYLFQLAIHSSYKSNCVFIRNHNSDGCCNGSLHKQNSIRWDGFTARNRGIEFILTAVVIVYPKSLKTHTQDKIPHLLLRNNCATKYKMRYDKMIFVYGAHARWRHQMETFSALLAICAGNSPVPGEFPTQRPVTRSFDVFFDLCLNTRLRKQSRGWWFETLSCPLWRHRNGKTRYVDGTPTSEVTSVAIRNIRPPHHGHTSQYHAHEWMTNIHFVQCKSAVLFLR